MTRCCLRRLVLSLVTLWLLVTIVFIIVNVLPNDVGRTIAGPFAPQETVDAINERLGTERSAARAVRPRDAQASVTFDFGDSFQTDQAGVAGDRGSAFCRSAKLAAYALLHDHPARDRRPASSPVRRQGQARRPWDRDRRARQLVDPGVRVGDVLVVVFGVQLGCFPVLATAAAGAGFARRSSAT